MTNEMAELVERWAFNVMLECSGRAETSIDVVMGGDVLNLRDLHDILEWVRLKDQGK